MCRSRTSSAGRRSSSSRSRGRARLDGVALALDGALEPAVYDRAMSRRRESANRSCHRKRRSVAAGKPPRPTVRRSERASRRQKTPARRRRGDGRFEARIGYRFEDPALLEQALTHISALTGARNRAGSYQRLEFLGDHVLGLVISDMLFRAFPKADEGEMSRRLADLVRKEACADVARRSSLARRSGSEPRRPMPAAAAAPPSSPMSARR